MVWYIPKVNKVDDLSKQLELIEDYPLGILITSQTSYLSNKSSIELSHLPFIIDKRAGAADDDDDGKIVLLTHLAKTNDQLKQLEELEKTGDEVIVIFRSMDSYVSASWYLQKKIDHRIVSTWDYSAVHVKGKPRIIYDKESLLGILNKITDAQESKRKIDDESRWKVQDAPINYINGLMNKIVGLEIEIVDIEGKFKLNQDHTKQEIDNLIKNYDNEIGGDKAVIMSKLTKENHPDYK